MVALAARDVESVLRFVAQAHEFGDDEPFPDAVVELLRDLVATESVAYCEQDRVRQRVRYSSGIWTGGEPEVSYWDIAHEHPVCSRHNQGYFGALKISDFMTLRELRRSHVFAVWFRPCGTERELNVAIPSPPWHTKTFLFDRGTGPDFTERDRLVLNLLQPHLGQLWRTARTRRQLRAVMAAVDGASEHDPRGFALLGSRPHVEFASPSARRLLRDYFGTFRDDELPTALARWLESHAATLVRRIGDRRLTLERAGEALLLEERQDESRLTAREHQILAWVARGKTNAEVAEVLWIAPTTVRKHLENIYAKLGVRTRTAAVTRFLGLLDAEEQREARHDQFA